MRRKVVRVVACLCSMVIGGVGVLSSAPLNVDALSDEAEMPEQLELPISLLDYNADNLLFEYDLYGGYGSEFAMTSNLFDISIPGASLQEKGQDTYVMSGLVEKELDPNTNLPVYKKETVEQVAKAVQLQLMNPSDKDTTEAFKALSLKLVKNDPEAINYIDITHVGKAHDYFFVPARGDDTGWILDGLPDYKIAYRDKVGIVRDSNGIDIWEHNQWGVHHLAQDGTSHAIYKTVELDSGKTYTLETELEGNGIQMEITGSSGTNETFNRDAAGRLRYSATISGESEITIRITTNTDSYVNWLQLKDNDENIRYLLKEPPVAKVTNTGWYPLEGSDWQENYENGNVGWANSNGLQWNFDNDGLVSKGDKSSVCKEITVRKGKDYVISYNTGGGSELKLSVYDGDSGTNLLADEVKSGTMIHPTQSTIRIVVQGTGDPSMTGWEQNKLVDLRVMEASVELGDYEKSEAKYADDKNGYDTIETCMDYAYYVLNNLFHSEADFNVPYGGYTSIHLARLGDDSDSYGFYAVSSDVEVENAKGKKVKYDSENKSIYNDGIGESGGLFPLDKAASYTDSQKGYTDREGNQHNFHYSLYSHASFFYEKDANLYFDFVGDDDVYLFINNKLAMDIGGAHLAAHDRIELNKLAAELELKEGRSYSFDFFYMERHTEFSNLAIETNIQLLDDGELQLNLYDEEGKPLQSGSSIEKGSIIQMEYEFRANVNQVSGIHFTDKNLGIEIGKDGLKFGDSVSLKGGAVKVSKYDADGNLVEEKTFTTEEEIKKYFGSLELSANEVIKVSGMQYRADEPLDAAVSVTFTTPDYSGAYTAESENTKKDMGNIQVTEPEETESENPKDTEQETESEDTEEEDTEEEDTEEEDTEEEDTEEESSETEKEDDGNSESSDKTPDKPQGDQTGGSISSKPKTGDYAPVAIYSVLMLFGLSGIVIELYRKRKEA